MRNLGTVVWFIWFVYAAAVAAQTSTSESSGAVATTPDEAIAILQSLSSECAGFPESQHKRSCMRCSRYVDELNYQKRRMSPEELVEYAMTRRIPQCRHIHDLARNPPDPKAQEEANAKELAAIRKALAEHLSAYVQRLSLSAPRVNDGGSLLRSGNLDWNAYEHGERLAAVFTGQFRDGDRAQMLMFFRGYLGAFSRTCERFLPIDSVRVITRMDDVTYNGLGVEIDRRKGSPIEVTMAPRFVDAYEAADPESQAMAGLVDIIARGANPLEFLTTVEDWIHDTGLFFEVEPCQGQAMLQLGENLLRLMERRRPLQDERDPVPCWHA